MSRRKIASQDGAACAGVSSTTVSYVLNNIETANSSKQTPLRVLDAAAALGYIPNAAVQMLVGHRPHLSGLVFPRTHPHLATHLFLLQLLEGLMAVVLPLARFAYPPLTTMRMPIIEMGRRAGELLPEAVDHT